MLDGPKFEFSVANVWKAAVVKRMTRGVAFLFKANGVEWIRGTGIATDARRRASVPHIYAVGDCAGHWQLAHTAFREGEVAAQNACGHDATVGNHAVPRPIYTDPEIASVGLTEAQAREQHGASPNAIGGHQGRRSGRARPGDRRPEPVTLPALRPGSGARQVPIPGQRGCRRAGS
jgi:pyruvate/2-oxoglutarate dehydrogenase complex dihydrolipoamide dehydrogenase (E3) component